MNGWAEPSRVHNGENLLSGETFLVSSVIDVFVVLSYWFRLLCDVPFSHPTNLSESTPDVRHFRSIAGSLFFGSSPI
jgi:hypothetical protein